MARLGETIFIFFLIVITVAFFLFRDSSSNIAAGGKLSKGEIIEALQFLIKVPCKVIIAEDYFGKAKKKATLKIRPLHQYYGGGLLL